MTEEEIRIAAVEFAKRNKNRIAKELTDPAVYAPDLVPISAFMAGSPGAGKEVAWKFTKAREEAEGRNIPKSAFIEQFFGARSTVSRIRKEFGQEVVIFLVKKDFERNTVENIVGIKKNDRSRVNGFNYDTETGTG